MLAIVRNTAYTWLHQKRTSPLVGIEDLTEKERAEIEEGNEQGDAAVDPEATVIARADANQLEKFIAALPMEFRETLVLRDLQGLGYREIAEITGVPAGTVMSRLARARQRLMSALREGKFVMASSIPKTSLIKIMICLLMPISTASWTLQAI